MKSNWKRFLTLLLTLIMLTSVLFGCGKSEQTEDPDDTEETQGQEEPKLNNVEKYFLYADDGKLYRLDAVAGEDKEIGLDFSVEYISNALVCDNNERMVAQVQKEGAEHYGLIYWDGKSDEAKYLGDETELARISKDGKMVWYTAENNDLYCYDAEKDISKKMIERIHGVAVREDGSGAFVSQIAEQNDTISLYFASSDGTVQKITETAANGFVNVSQDCSAICYLNYTRSTENPYVRQAYIWTEAEGEKKLPFEASNLQIFASNEIYYQQAYQQQGQERRYAHYYYDGKDSHLLSENGTDHGHKAGNYLYYYRGRVEGEYKCYVAYKGQSIETNIFFCNKTGYTAFTSRDDKSFYGIQDGVMYQVRLGADGKLTETVAYSVPLPDYSPRYMTFQDGYMECLTSEGDLYLNDTKIAEGIAVRGTQSSLGNFLVYKKDGNLYAYVDGETTQYPVDEATSSYCPAQGGRVVSLVEEGSLTLHYTEGGTVKTATFGEKVTDWTPVYTWSCTDTIDHLYAAERTGVWFHRDFNTLVWNR